MAGTYCLRQYLQCFGLGDVDLADERTEQQASSDGEPGSGPSFRILQR
jgi:hypothetical protein